MTYHDSARMTHFKVLYGRNPKVLLKLVEKESKVKEVNLMIHMRNEVLDELKDNLHKAQERVKKMMKKRRREVQFKVRDLVFLKFQPYCFEFVPTRFNENLSPCHYGPYEILAKVESMAYKCPFPQQHKSIIFFLYPN